jgi:predicted DNA binding CopG/RHH family protein
LLRGDFKPVKGKELENIENALKSRRKNTTMTIRVNSEDIEKIKSKEIGNKIPILYYRNYTSGRSIINSNE